MKYTACTVGKYLVSLQMQQLVCTAHKCLFDSARKIKELMAYFK